MPNHITNLITARSSKTLEAIKTALCPESSDEPDFNRLIPETENDPNWYEWRLQNWGTKWNAYEPFCYGDDFMQFDTAWSYPEQVVRALAKAVPEDWTWAYADEDLGYNCGWVSCVKGRLKHHLPTHPLEFACDIKGVVLEEHMREQAED